MLREVEKEEANPFVKYIEYLEGDQIVGTLKYSFIYDRIEIDSIEVELSHRNRQIGSKLMGRLIAIAIENRVVNITLEVRVSNEVAIHLYKKFGFREVALRKYYYGDEDAILMEKQVM